MIKRISKPFILSLLSCLLVANIGIDKTSIVANAANTSNTYSSSNIARGADIGWVSQLEDIGIKWINDNGNTEDPLKILKDKGIDSVRLRVFVDPPSNYTWTKRDRTVCYLGYSDKDSVVAMAKRAKELDMKIMIDFHYSDHFADPAYQDKPKAWENHTFNKLKEDVYNHTTEVMTALANEGIYPEWVQVGNETNSGMLWDDGYIWDGSSTPNVTSWSQLINEGYSAVKNISPSSKVILHLAHGYDNSLFRNIFDALKDAGTNYDVIGMSYYPYWEGSEYTDSINDIIYNLNDMSSRYNKDVMICEIGGLENEATETYNLIKAAIKAVSDVPNGRGLGVFYWEPAVSSSVLPDEYPLGACTEISKNTLKFTTALDAFKDSAFNDLNTNSTYKIVNRISGKALNVSGGSHESGAAIEQYTYYGWNSQKWKLISSGNGYYKIMNVGSGKVLDISKSSLQNGASNIQSNNNNGLNQQWKLIKTEDNYYKIQNRNSSKVLDIKASSKDECASSIQWEDNGGWNQMWILVEVD